MSLNYGTLKTQILEDAHRPGLTSKVDDFVRHAEGMIARRLRCTEMITRVDLTDSDRVTAGEGFFTLPSDFLEDRSLYLEGSPQVRLEKTSLSELRTLSTSAPVRYYGIVSDDEIEFRGIPSDTATLELIYFARPAAFSADGDTNEILTNHEIIYLAGALNALYAYTQDRELAADAGNVFLDAVETLNEQAGRAFGGTRGRGFYELSSWDGR